MALSITVVVICVLADTQLYSYSLIYPSTSHGIGIICAELCGTFVSFIMWVQRAQAILELSYRSFRYILSATL